MRHPHACNAPAGISHATNAPTAEPSITPANAPEVPKAPIKPRRELGHPSTMKMTEVVYSPPTESPCTRRNTTISTDAVTPICLKVGSSPMRNVGTAIATTESVSALRRP